MQAITAIDRLLSGAERHERTVYDRTESNAMPSAALNSHRRVHSVVSRIPRGRVATYGQVARLAGIPGQARLVGYALNALHEGTAIPWHRVVNAKGTVSARSSGSGHDHSIRWSSR